MEGIIASFRRGRHRTRGNQVVVYVDGLAREEARSLVGKPVSWTSPGKAVITGRVSTLHGTKGALRVVFERGIPGQALSQKVRIG